MEVERVTSEEVTKPARRPTRRYFIPQDSMSDTEVDRQLQMSRQETLGTDDISPRSADDSEMGSAFWLGHLSSDGESDEEEGSRGKVRFNDHVSTRSALDWWSVMVRGDGNEGDEGPVQVTPWRQFFEVMEEGREVVLISSSRFKTTRTPATIFSDDELASLCWLYKGKGGENRVQRLPASAIVKVVDLTMTGSSGSGRHLPAPVADASASSSSAAATTASTDGGNGGPSSHVRLKLKWRTKQAPKKRKLIIESNDLPQCFVTCMLEVAEFYN